MCVLIVITVPCLIDLKTSITRHIIIFCAIKKEKILPFNLQ